MRNHVYHTCCLSGHQTGEHSTGEEQRQFPVDVLGGSLSQTRLQVHRVTPKSKQCADTCESVLKLKQMLNSILCSPSVCWRHFFLPIITFERLLSHALFTESLQTDWTLQIRLDGSTMGFSSIGSQLFP